MNENPLNIVLLLIVVINAVVVLAYRQSPDALDSLALRLRARARAIRASREAWTQAYQSSLRDDVEFERDREELRKIMQPEIQAK
jgi:hypothetical protein